MLITSIPQEWKSSVSAAGNLRSTTYFTNNLCDHNSNIFLSDLIVMIRSGHNFAHVTTAELSWHVQNCDKIRLSSYMQNQCLFWQDLNYELKPVKWLPGVGHLSHSGEQFITSQVVAEVQGRALVTESLVNYVTPNIARGILLLTMAWIHHDKQSCMLQFKLSCAELFWEQ